MSITLRISLIIGIVIYFSLILYLIRKQKFVLKYALLWMGAGFVALLAVVFPNMVKVIVDITGVKSEVNGVFSIILFFIILILISLTSIVSMQGKKIRELAQYVAVLNKKLTEVEKFIISKEESKEE